MKNPEIRKNGIPADHATLRGKGVNTGFVNKLRFFLALCKLANFDNW